MRFAHHCARDRTSELLATISMHRSQRRLFLDAFTDVARWIGASTPDAGQRGVGS